MNALSLFDSLFNNQLDNDFDGFGYKSFYAPKVDVTESKDSYSLEMELPGMTNDDVNIELDANKLTISSKKESFKNAEKSEKGKNDEKAEENKPKYLIKERHSLHFSRSFTLPDDVDGTKIGASFKNGILTVSLPRKEIAAPRRIMIDVA